MILLTRRVQKNCIPVFGQSSTGASFSCSACCILDKNAASTAAEEIRWSAADKKTARAEIRWPPSIRLTPRRLLTIYETISWGFWGHEETEWRTSSEPSLGRAVLFLADVAVLGR